MSDRRLVTAWVGAHRMELDALNATIKWMQADPFYKGEKMTEREYAIARLALRMMTHPQEYAPPATWCPKCGDRTFADGKHMITNDLRCPPKELAP